MSLKFQSYEEVRDQIESGDLYFTASKTLIGSTIRAITRSNLSHVGMFLKDPDGRIKMLEAQIGNKIAEVYASKVLKDMKFVFLSTKHLRDYFLLSWILLWCHRCKVIWHMFNILVICSTLRNYRRLICF